MRRIIELSPFLACLAIAWIDERLPVTDDAGANIFRTVNRRESPRTKTGFLHAPEEGTYYIKCRAGTKYLDVSWSCRNNTSCKVQLWSLGNNTSNNKWVIKKEGLPFSGEYSIRAVVNGKYLTSYGDDNGDPVDVSEREFIFPITDPHSIATWYFEEIGYNIGLYKIKNKGCNKYLDAANNCVNENGCKVQIWSGQGEALSSNWFLIKP